MSDNLEKFISGNRNAFDDKVPPGKIWDHIDAALTGKKKKMIPAFLIKWSMAAAAALIIGAVLYLKNDTKEFSGQEVIKPGNVEVPDEPKIMEFAKIIVLKQEELRQLSKEQPKLYSKFTRDIIQLDSAYNALRNQLRVTPNKEILLEAMIQNLQLQLGVLNQQLNIIKHIKQSKEYNHEKSFPAI